MPAGVAGPIASSLVVLLVAAGCGRVAFDQVRERIEPSDGGSCGMDAACVDAGPVGPPNVCGDGVVAGGEACDDGNGANDDGCDNDCAFSCTTPTDCDDGAACNGAEQCAAHVCVDGAPAPDGTPCDTGDSTCRAGSCAAPGCGNGRVDSGEDCDDDNVENGDGCDNDCTFSCGATGCLDDGDACNGSAVCNEAIHVCELTSPLAPGSPCDRDADPLTRDICLEPGCVPSRCGDDYLDAPLEECDDGNAENGDGCDADCTYSCVRDADCADGNPCTTEGCDPATHICVRGVAAGGTPCPGGSCVSGACVRDDGGVIRTDGGLAPGTCWEGADCAAGEMCCPAAPCAGVCWAGPVCPLIKCAFDSGGV